MFDKINKISFGKSEPKEKKKSIYHKTNDMPNDSLELSTPQKPKTLAGKLTQKIVEKVVQQKSAIEQKSKVSPIQIYQDLIKDGFHKDTAKNITENRTLLKRYILFTSEEKDENGNLLSGLQKPLNSNEAVTLIEHGIDETQLKDVEKLLSLNFFIHVAINLLKNKPLMELLNDKVDENGKLLSGLPTVPKGSDIKNMEKYSEDQIKKFISLVSEKTDEKGTLISGLTRPFKYSEAFDYIKYATASSSPQFYIDLVDNYNSFGYHANKIIENEDLQQRIYMLCGDEKAKQTSPFSQKFELSEAITFIEKELTDEQIETYIKTPKEKHDNGLYYYERYPLANLIKKGLKEKESFQMFSILDSKYMFNNTFHMESFYPIITNPDTVKLFSLLTNPQKDEKTGKYLSGCNRKINDEEATTLCISLSEPNEQLPKCIQLINLGVSVDDAIHIVATKYYNEEERDRFADFMSFISDEKDENGKLKSGLEEPLSIEHATFIVEERIPYKHIPLFIEMVNDGLYEYQIKNFLKEEDSCIHYKELRANREEKNYSLSPSEAYTIVEKKIDDSQIAKFVELTREKSAIALGLKRGLTSKEASCVVKENIAVKQIPLFLEILSDEKDENGNLKSGLKKRIEWTDIAASLVKKGYSKEQIIRFSEVFQMQKNNSYDCIQVHEAEDIVENNLNDEELEKYLYLNSYPHNLLYNSHYSSSDYAPKTEEERKEFKKLVFSIIKDEKKFERYKSLTDYDNSQMTFPSLVAVRFVAPEIFSEKQIEFYNRLDSLYRNYDNPLAVFDFAKDKDNYEKYCHYTSSYELDINGEKRPLTADEAVHVVYNNVSEEKIPQFVKLLNANQNKNSVIIAKLVANNIFSIEQVELYRTMIVHDFRGNPKNEEMVIDILSTPEKLERYKLITSSELDSNSFLLNSLNQSLKRNDNAKLKSGLKRALPPITAMAFLSPKIIDNKRINEYLSIVDAGANSDKAIAIFSNDEKYEQYSTLISKDKTPDGNLKSGLTRPLSEAEAFDAIDNELNLQQIKLLIEFIDGNLPIRDAISAIKDEKIYPKIIYYTSKEVDENGNLKNKLPRPLTSLEAYKITNKNLTISQISKYIDIYQNNMSIDTAIVLAKDFSFLNGRNKINELSLQEKRKLLKALISNNSSLFGLKLPNGEFKLIPSNQKEYCQILDKLAKSIGIDTRALSDEQKTTCYEGLKEIADILTYSNIDNYNISLDFSRDEFLQKTKDVLSKLDSLEQRKVMDYFGFEIRNGKLIGYPINVNNGEKLKEIENQNTKVVVEELRPIVQKFSVENKINIPENKKLEESLNKILEGLPELRTIIAKKHHPTHDYSIDKHTIKVLQNVVKNPSFETLSESDKRLITMAALFHDIAKREEVVDKIHPTESAFDAFYIIQKFNLPEDEQLKLYQLIKTHDWLEQLNVESENSAKIEKNIAFNMRHSNTFELSKILCEADLKSIKKDESFWTNFENTFIQKSKVIQNYLDTLEKSKIVLPQTKIPKASEMENLETRSANGITNKVLFIQNCDNDLSKYGFEKGTTVENWKGLVHALDYETQLRNFDTFSIIDSDALLSTSYMNPKEYQVFRKQGLILDVHPSDIHAGYYKDFGSGYTKNLELLQKDYLFGGSWSGYRTYISDLIKSKLKLNDDAYTNRLKKIEGCKSITDIEKIDKEFASALQNVFNEMDTGKRSHGRKYNEMLISRPKIQGVFSYGQDYESIPKFLRKYAQDNDFPIIMFG